MKFKHLRQLREDYELAHDPFVAELGGGVFREPDEARCVALMKGYVAGRKDLRLRGRDYDGSTRVPDAEIERYVRMRKARRKGKGG